MWIGLALVVLAAPPALAEEGEPRTRRQKRAEQLVEAQRRGYPEPKRQIGTPLDVEADFQQSFPQPGAMFPGLTWPDSPIVSAKEYLDRSLGLKLALSYQSMVMVASQTQMGDPVAAGGVLLFEARWELFDRDGDYEASIAGTIDWRHPYGDLAAPGLFGLRLGSQSMVDVIFLNWDPVPTSLYWEQWLKKDFLVFRIGHQTAGNIFDFYRFKDGRTSTTGSTFANSPAAVPSAPPGFGISFELWPFQDDFYVVGTMNDLNANPGRLEWSGLAYGEFFLGLEVGYNWKRKDRTFDHLHAMLFYADARSRPSPIPISPVSERGWGFKFRGTKQWGQFVASAAYTFNTARGGGFGTAVTQHETALTLAYVFPLFIRGELAASGSWNVPIDRSLRDQWGAEAYWKLLVIPSVFVTPGVQFLFNPSFFPTQDTIAIGQLKFRILI